MTEAIPQSGRVDDLAFPTVVLLVRHGESMPVVPGTPEARDPGLSPRGAEQAAAVATRLADAELTAVYSSDMARASETAAAIAAPHGLTPTARHDLREVDLGDWEEGGFRQRAAALDPDYLAFVTAGRWEVIPGAEADDDLRARVVTALDEIATTQHGGRVVVVAHGGTINAWLADRFGSHRSMIVATDNTAITVLQTDGTNWIVRSVNDRHHLGDGVVTERATFVLGVDLDGVCGDYTAAFADVVAVEKGCAVTDLPLARGWDFDEWDLEAIGGFEHLHRMAVLEQRIFRDMPVIEGCAEALWRLSDAGVWIRIITHRLVVHWGHQIAVGDTVTWLDAQGIPYRDLCFLGRKPEVEADLYVDDAPHNVEALRSAGNDVIVFDQPYNHGVDGLRARSWAEVEEITIATMVDRGFPVQPVLPTVADDPERLHRRVDG